MSRLRIVALITRMLWIDRPAVGTDIGSRAMLAASTRNGSTTFAKYVSSFQGRVAHSLLIGALVGKQLALYASGSNVTIKGEDIILGAAEVQAVAIVLHELVTNAQ